MDEPFRPHHDAACRGGGGRAGGASGRGAACCRQEGGEASAGGRPVRRRLAAGLLPAVAPLALVLFPKCPLCWLALLGALGLAGTWSLAVPPWLLASLVVLLLLHLALLCRRASTRNGRRVLAVSLLGATLVLLSTGTGLPAVGYAGVACVVLGSCLAAGGPVTTLRAGDL